MADSFDADRVIAGIYPHVFHRHVSARVRIDPIVAAQRMASVLTGRKHVNVVNVNVLAPDRVNMPARSIAQRDVPDLQPCDTVHTDHHWAFLPASQVPPLIVLQPQTNCERKSQKY